MDWTKNFDEAVFTFINRDLTNPVFDFLFPHLTDLHQTIWFQIIAIPLLLYAIFKKYGKTGAIVIGGLLLSLATTDAVGGWLKKLLQRPRPFTNLDLEVIQRSGVGSFSFPSNHAGNMFCFACFMALFFPKLRGWFFGFAALIALTRVYNGVHYPSDVAAGAMLGSFVGLTFGFIVLKVLKAVRHPGH